MTTTALTSFTDITDKEYKSRIWAWTMYDWANSAFATTVLAAVLPIYFSQVAGATLPSPAVATAYWSAGLSISMLLAALISPVLGTVSDIMRGKKRFLAFFSGIGILGTALLVFVSTGDWVLASILAIIGRVGFSGANVFYDALLPHVAREEDQDVVSTRGYALGYLGGGLLLAINVLMIQLLPGTWGPRLFFLSVAAWWAIFSIPLFLRIPEPPAAAARRDERDRVIPASFRRLWQTLKDVRQYRELSKYVFSYLIYIDGIGTIIAIAAIYGAELGFSTIELILALLLVQFVGIPFSLIFGRLPSRNESRRPFFLAFVLFNMLALPVFGIAAARFLPAEITGKLTVSFQDTPTAVGEGRYQVESGEIVLIGDWQPSKGAGENYFTTMTPGDRFDFPFNGQELTFLYSIGPEHGIWRVELDGRPYIDQDSEAPLLIDAYNPIHRYEMSKEIIAESAGVHTFSVINTGDKNPAAHGTMLSLSQIEVLPPLRQSNLLFILVLIIVIQLIGLVLAFAFGRALFSNLAKSMTTKRTLLLSLVVYSLIAIWGYFLDSVVEFWFLAWMVATVQGGSQALSRSLFCYMSPAAKSGEFFGVFGVMEKFSAIFGPAFFAMAAAVFGSSRPAVLSIIAFFIVGGLLLSRVNVEEGRRVALADDAASLVLED
jgi:MFS transporter, UMF1 family